MFTTIRVNTLSQIFNAAHIFSNHAAQKKSYISLLVSSLVLTLFFSVELLAESVTTSSTSNTARRLTTLQINPLDLNFKFENFQTFWITNAQDWKSLWADHSQTPGQAAPDVPVNWHAEAILAIFWKSEDTKVRWPALMGTEDITSSSTSARKMRLNFILTTPCFGIITDRSPAYFVVINHQLADLDGIDVRSDNAKMSGCY